MVIKSKEFCGKDNVEGLGIAVDFLGQQAVTVMGVSHVDI